MSYVIIEELELLVKDMSYTKKELVFDYPLLEYASTYVFYHAEKAED